MPLSLWLLRCLVHLIEKAFSVRITWTDKPYRPHWLEFDELETDEVGACVLQHEPRPIKKFSGEVICQACGRELGEWV